MDLDSPEAEQEFPGLYAESKSGDEESRKILSVKKKKDKEKGYRAFEEDGSGASCEDVTKVSSSRRFKFGKSGSKATSAKPTKVKLFGVDLKEVLVRNPSVDSRTPLVPKLLTDLLNHVEKNYDPGHNFYKGTSHFKSKIHQARHALNYGQEPTLQEPQIAAGLVKLFLRELPSHILGSTMESKLEEAKLTEKKTQKIQNLYQKEVAGVNQAVFERLVLHMEIIGIDLTPLLKVCQKALDVLKPVMRPLSIEDELKVEEARLARMHWVLAKLKASKDKHKSKENNQEKLWEAQRNVTQLKRKLKQLTLTNTTEIKEVELNLEERRDDDDTPAEHQKVDEVDHGDQKGHPVESTDVRPPESHTEATRPEEKTSEEVRVEITSEGINQETKPAGTQGMNEVSCDTNKKGEGDKPMLEAPAGIQSKVSPAAEPKHHQILQPVPAPVIEAKIEPEPLTHGVDVAGFEDEAFAPENDVFASDVVNNIPITKPEALSGKPLDASELKRVQQEWKDVIVEQTELLRVKDEIRRRIRDEHKQIKMIQMVRNHKSRVAPMKPVFQDPLEEMSTDKLREILQSLIESNAKLTKDNQALSDKVFEARMTLVQIRTSQRQASIS